MNVRDREAEDAMSFGRQGYGAPVRTKSGRLRWVWPDMRKGDC